VKKPFLSYERSYQDNFYVLGKDECEFEGETYEVLLTHAHFVLKLTEFEAALGPLVKEVGKVVGCLDYYSTREKLEKDGQIKLNLEGKELVLKHKVHIFKSFQEYK